MRMWGTKMKMRGLTKAGLKRVAQLSEASYEPQDDYERDYVALQEGIYNILGVLDEILQLEMLSDHGDDVLFSMYKRLDSYISESDMFSVLLRAEKPKY